MTFIKLTRTPATGGGQIWVNLMQVITVDERPEGTLLLSALVEELRVVETPEQMFGLVTWPNGDPPKSA